MSSSSGQSELSQFRNFSIIAHIDHGKTTLTDRFLRRTHAVTDFQFRERFMDSNPIEQERGITIKLAPVRMEYNGYFLNLIDTPGHVDFGYEVSRSLAACEGALLLVDATQGVQAQTLSNFEKAKALNLKIIPVLNKIDLPNAEMEQVSLEMMEAFGFNESDIMLVSGKTGLGVDELLDKIISTIPAPVGDASLPLQALVFTSHYDEHKGVVAYVRVVQGTLRRQDLILLATQTLFTPAEIGIFQPHETPVEVLKAGEVGYIATGLKDASLIKVGDTVAEYAHRSKTAQLPGYTVPSPMVYMELFPIDGQDFNALKDAMGKLHLHDSSLVYASTHSKALGNGLRVGFLGRLHADIVKERLDREFGLDLIATAPSVPYKILTNQGEWFTLTTPGQMPDLSFVKEIHEPMTESSLFLPKKYLGAIMQLCQDHRGVLDSIQDIGTRVKVTYRLPLAELITAFHDQMQSVSSGFASLEYKVTDFALIDAVKLSVLVNKEEIEALSVIVVRDEAEEVGKQLVKKLKEVIPRQLFEIPIQAAIGGTVVARETIKAYRKDVTAKLYGGDVTRRQKLLKKQAKGKKKMKQIGKVELNQEAFLAVLERN